MDIGPRRQATASEFDALYGMLIEASAWLRGKGLAQWNPTYPSARFAREIDAGCVWYWAVSGEAVATATLYTRRPDYYPGLVWRDETAAWYLCRLAVARSFAGHRVGERVLENIEREARAAGIEALRLDVTSSNPFLEPYYLARGFLRHQSLDLFGEPSALLEKRMTRPPSGTAPPI